jgi:hypothetical protein
VPYSEAVLEKLKSSYVLVAVFPLSIFDIRGKVERGLFSDDLGYFKDKKFFAKEKGEACWHLIRKTEVPKSISETWNDQCLLLGKDDEVPTARVMTYTIIGHYLATGERLFEWLYVRTSSVGSDGYRVCLGFFVQFGLYVYLWWDGFRDDDFGLASARKLSRTLKS